MPKPYEQIAVVDNAIKNILEHYPLVDGPIRELLQNSDDAGATKHIFVLDRRSHPIASLVENEFIAYQKCPALISYNNAYFKPQDWESLKRLFESNKVRDRETLGQFGQGFRCVYHLTDCPQIFSGNDLALLSLSKGQRLDTTNPSDAEFTSHFTAFEGLPHIPCRVSRARSREADAQMGVDQDFSRLDGTAIRLPLRERPSFLSTKCSKPEDLLKLFDEFIRHDLECVLLFLKNIKDIEVYEVSIDGSVREICSAQMGNRTQEIVDGRNHTSWRVEINTKVYSGSSRANATTVKSSTTTWRILDCPFTDESSRYILRRLSREHNPEEEMDRRKLNTRVRIAAPLVFTVTSRSNASTSTSINQSSTSPASCGVSAWRHGRVFSGLPLPRANNKNWPVHVDAGFAIPPSRQYIRSPHEGGFIGEWNSLLFSAFIPTAWKFLLNILAQHDRVKDIFEYWPPQSTMNDHIINPLASDPGSSRFSSGGASNSPMPNDRVSRSQGMLQTVFSLVVAARASVWPLCTPSLPNLPAHLPASTTSTPLVFLDLDSVKVARDDTHFPDLRNTLAQCGIQFTKPPLHFKTLIEGYEKVQFLTPVNVYDDLLDNISRVEELISEEDRHAGILLDYLVKGQDIQLLIGLPLIKNVDGHYITLERLKSGSTDRITKQTLHPLFDNHTTHLFRDYDSNAILLNELKIAHATFLREKAPGVLNVIELTPEKIAEYLTSDEKWASPPDYSPLMFPVTSGSSPIPASITVWLTRFYSWLLGWQFAKDFMNLPQVLSLHLVPTHSGLKRLDDEVFDAGAPPALAKCLRALRLNLLDHTAGCEKVFASSGQVLKKVEDIHAILEAAQVVPNLTAATSRPSPISLGLTCVEWRTLIDHIVRSVNVDDLSPEEVRKLRLLPIYPILPVDPEATSPRLTPIPGPIPENHFVYAVTRIEILPVIDACVFLDFRGWPTRSYEILRLLDPQTSENSPPLTPIDIFNLAVRNFGSQSPALRGSVVKFAVTHERMIARESLEKLLDTASVLCKDNAVRKPRDVFDPADLKSDFSFIVTTCNELDSESAVFDEYLPRPDATDLIQDLRKLPQSPFRTHLDQELLLRITSCISTHANRPEAVDISRKLFKLLASNPKYADFIKAIPGEIKWIATNSGIKAQQDCRDRNAHSALLDEVYAIVDADVVVTDALRGVLGWTEDVTLDALTSQLDATLKKGGGFTRVRDIVKAIGTIALSDADLSRLRVLLNDRPWVPTKSGLLVVPKNAVIDEAIEAAEFCEVSFNEKAIQTPTTSMIIARSQENAHLKLTEEQIKIVVKLLERLPDNLSPDEKTQVLVPNVEGCMLAINDLYFNDTGVTVDLSDVERRNKSIAHLLVHDRIARTLGIEPLANHYSDFIPGYMGESFISSIRNAITEYTETQMLIEMLANAVDAGAQRFTLIVDNMPQSPKHLISSNLSLFQKSPALLIYNNAQFTEEDFKGLCQTGEGSKKDNGDSIGQFGRGALTMFHLTEFPTLISSSTAMFIDPTTKHLPSLPQNANNQRINLETLKRFYPGHLSFLETLADQLGYDNENVDTFGTVFRLPLRTPEHIDHPSPISTATWTTQDVLKKLLPPFQSIARDCLLFTELDCIDAYIRTPEGTINPLWSFEAHRGGLKDQEGIHSTMVQITQDQTQPELWQTVSYTVPDEDIPGFAASVTKAFGRRMKKPKVALAAFIRPEGADYEDYHQKNVYFSILPLPEPTGLPVRCSGTFQMASDRRHMRLDLENDSGNQAQFNEWLLKEIVPPTYLHLLELLLVETGVPNHHFWPVNDRIAADKIIISSLYEKFLKSTRKPLFQSAFDSQRHLTPDEVVILSSRSDILPVIQFLQPSNVAIYSEPFLSLVTDDAQLPAVSPQYVKEQILQDPHRFLEALTPADDQQPVLSSDDLTNLLDFFLLHDPDQLVGLPLLPLEDGTLGVIELGSSEHSFYVWRNHSIPNRTFANPGRLVRLDFNANGLLGRGFNIEELTSSSLAMLIADRFPRRPYLDIPDPSNPDAQFIADFWANFQLLKLEFKDIEGFPLVPILHTNRYISLKICKEGEVPIVPSRVSDFACQCLAILHVPMVQISSPQIHPQLRRILENPSLFREFKMGDILLALQNVNFEILLDSFFNHLSNEDRSPFCAWMRTQLFFNVPDGLRDTARLLPVWRAVDHEGEHGYTPATELVLLPQSLPDINVVAPWMRNHKIIILDQSQTDLLRSTMKHQLLVPEMSYRQLLREISSNLPTSMPDPETRASYKTLLEILLDRTDPHEVVDELRLPNAFDFTLSPAREFYSREEPLFHAAFAEPSIKFVAPEFEHLQGRSTCFITIRDITMDIFAECVHLIANNSDENGAEIAFDVMNDRLPRILGGLGPEADRWDMVEHLDFVPKKIGNLWRGSEEQRLDVTQYVQRPFDMLVAPRELVRAEYEGIAWSQRAIPARSLNEGLVRAYMAIGRPMASEVIAHLHVLKQVALDHPNHPAVLADITHTYQHLNECLRHEDFAAHLAEITDVPVFLNVDDPHENGVAWVWEPASTISFDVRDVGNFRFARRFLQQYRPLLVAAGAQEVNHLSTQRPPTHAPGVDTLSRVREKFSQMRRARHLVDVRFVAHGEDENSGDPLLGHRSFLATQSDHLMTAFCSGFMEQGPASADNPIRVSVEHSRESIALVLDYVYDGRLSNPSSLDVLLEAVSLGNYWQMEDFVEAAQDCVVENWLHPDTLAQIKRFAEEGGFTRLERDCETYRRDNADYIDRARGGGDVAV